MLDRITLITGNADKAGEYAAMLASRSSRAKVELIEVQSIDVESRKSASAYAQPREPVLVNDTGLAIHAWKASDAGPGWPERRGHHGPITAARRAGESAMPTDGGAGGAIRDRRSRSVPVRCLDVYSALAEH
jgi:hypothetical protein